MKVYIEVSVTATEHQREFLLPTMIELGFQGFLETDTELLGYFDGTELSRERIASITTRIQSLLRTISANADVRIREIVEENWTAEWKRTIQPIEIGKRIVVRPSWAQYENRNGRIEIVIDPKMSFGTGYHESTRLAIRLIEKHIRRGDTMLDVGTGTGILAVAAIRLGAAAATGIDNDHWAVENALENTIANEVNDRVQITSTPLPDLPRNHYRLIAANLSLNPILELLPAMLERLSENGTFILSGLLLGDEKKLKLAMAESGLTIMETISEGEWFAAAARRT